MHRLVMLVFVVSSAGSALAQQPWKPSPHVAATDPLPAEKQLKKFHLPPGFEIQLVAAEPDINKPININFDARGRLWVTGSTEYPFPAKDGKGKDKVWILDDFAPNGRARKITVFADDLNIPIGVLPLTPKGKEASALVYSIPNIYRLTDTTGKGKYDKKEVLFSGFGYKDTHGMTGEFTWGFDGWVYACHGFANTSKVKDKTGQVKIEMQSGNVYRFKPDGSKIEYFTHGQVNPFGLAFDSAGNLFSCDCHSRPLYHLLRGAWYPSFQKPHDGLGFGPEMMTHSHGSTAIAGIAVYEADHFPREYRGNVFIGNVITNRINRDEIQVEGSSPRAVEKPDFLKCDDPWFRPVDIKLGPDGAIYVVDFYNRIIGHYEVPLDHPGRDREKGRIWRIVYKGKNPHTPLRAFEDLTQHRVGELVDRLNVENLALRMLAANVLVERGGKEVIDEVANALRKGNIYRSIHALWILERLGRLQEKDLIDAIAGVEISPIPALQIQGLRILAEPGKMWQEGRAMILKSLETQSPFVQRVAAEALANHPQVENIAPLLKLRAGVSARDTHLLHVVRMALRDQLKAPAAWSKLGMLPEKDSAAMADVCPGLRSPESAEFLLTHLERYRESAANLSRYSRHIARYGSETSTPKLLTLLTQKIKPELSTQAAVFKAIQQGHQERDGKTAPETAKYYEKLTRTCLASSKASEIQLGIDLASALKVSSVAGDLVTIAQDRSAPESHRKGCLTALATIDPQKHVELFAKVLSDAAETPEMREQAVQSLGSANSAAAHDHLVKALAAAPARLERPIALALAGNKLGAEKLLDAVAAGKASARLLQENPLVVRLGECKVANLDARIKKLTAGLPPADKRLFKLLAQRRDGFLKAKADVALGAKIFAKNCANCHAVNNEGAKIAPQLDGIGIRGLDRLLEDILDPNRNVDQAFRATTLTMKNGQLVSGLLLKQEGQVLVLADALGKEQRLDSDAVESRTISQLSPMPATFAEQIGESDFNHLMAFLLSQTAQKK